MDNNKLEKFIKNAIAYYLDVNESTITNMTYEDEIFENKSESLYKALADKGYASKRILALLSMVDEVKNMKKCPNCHHTEFTHDCSMIVCKNCYSEFFIKTPETIEYCKECHGYTIGKCEAKLYIDQGVVNAD